MKKFALVGFVVITVFAVSMYIYLGGSNERNYEIEESKFHFQGVAYEGPVKSEKPNLLFNSSRDIALANEEVSIAVLNKKTASEDSISQVIGLASAKPFERELLSADTSMVISGSFVKAIISAHSIVMPNPQEVIEEAKDFANQKGLTLKSWSLEIYRGEKSLEVYFPIADD